MNKMILELNHKYCVNRKILKTLYFNEIFDKKLSFVQNISIISKFKVFKKNKLALNTFKLYAQHNFFVYILNF
jgi:hypothetical protein